MIFVVKGISGSGKSSRIFQLIEFIRLSLGELALPVVHVNGYTRHHVGVRFEKQQLTVLGKRYVSGALSRWQGLDSVTGAFGGSEHISEFLSECQGNVIVEGAGIMDSYRFRPKFLHEECGFGAVYMQYYNYNADEKEAYLNRTRERTGAVPRKDSMWNKRRAYELEYKKSLIDQEELDCPVWVKYDGYDADIEDFGDKYLKTTHQKHLIVSFHKFVKEFHYVVRNRYDIHRGSDKLF